MTLILPDSDTGMAGVRVKAVSRLQSYPDSQAPVWLNSSVHMILTALSFTSL
jgi:hypothetical protein